MNISDQKVISSPQSKQQASFPTPRRSPFTFLHIHLNNDPSSPPQQQPKSPPDQTHSPYTIPLPHSYTNNSFACTLLTTSTGTIVNAINPPITRLNSATANKCTGNIFSTCRGPNTFGAHFPFHFFNGFTPFFCPYSYPRFIPGSPSMLYWDLNAQYLRSSAVASIHR